MPTLASSLIEGPAGQGVWIMLLHAVWLGLLAAATVALTFRVGVRLSHRARYAILAVAMIVVAAGPVSLVGWSAALPSRAVEKAAPASTELIVQVGPASPEPEPERRTTTAGPPASRQAPRSNATLALARLIAAVERARTPLLSVWSIVVLALAAVLILGMRSLASLRREGELAPHSIRDRVDRLALPLGIARAPTVLIHPRLVEPFLCGIFRPAILLPARWSHDAPTASLDAILAHELAHAVRRDQLVNVLQRLLEIALFFHPAVHWLSRSLRREREHLADAMAVRFTGDPLALAESLQSIARLRLESPRIAAAAGASLGGPSTSLLPRIQELIGMTPSRPRLALWPFAALPAAGLFALVALSAGFADDRPAASSRVETSRRESTGPAAKSSTDRPMIRYEVRFITGPAEPWRMLMLPRLKPLKLDADLAALRTKYPGLPDDQIKAMAADSDLNAWLLDEKAVIDLLTRAQQDTRTNCLQAPKVTADDGARATISNRGKHHYVAGIDRPENGKVGFVPVVKNVMEGITLDLTGKRLPHATRLTVGLDATRLLGFHTMHQYHRIGEQIQAPQYQIPTTAKTRGSFDCTLAEGTYLLVSLGVHDEARPIRGAASLANGVLGAAGLPTVQNEPETIEWLVLIRAEPMDGTEKPRPTVQVSNN